MNITKTGEHQCLRSLIGSRRSPANTWQSVRPIREGVERQQRDLFGINLMAFSFFLGRTGDNSHNSNAVFAQSENDEGLFSAPRNLRQRSFEDFDFEPAWLCEGREVIDLSKFDPNAE